MKQYNYFEGWYYKQQNQSETVALIPAFHADETGQKSASLQIITDHHSYNINYRMEDCYVGKKRFSVRLGSNVFTDTGCKLSCKTDAGNRIRGVLCYTDIIRPIHDIMGPFRWVPFMQCRHSVFSMRHQVQGWIAIDDKRYSFERGKGYWEGDRGRSFPKRYIWTQCIKGKCSIMLSAADIPIGPTSFTGCIGFILLDNREYRIATYLGAKVVCVTRERVLISQGELILVIRLLQRGGYALRAPQSGKMSRTIHENPSCKVRYTIIKRRKIVLDFVSDQASYEYAWDELE